ncbi:zinc ribbon domain-containing protein [Thermodesulfobacteriota bacterium]
MMQPVNKEQIDVLVRLQEIELESVSLGAMLADVPGKIDALESQLNEFKRVIEGEESSLSELQKKYRSYESDAQTTLDQIKKRQQRLNSVKTNIEYQSTLKEIEELEMKNSEIEDEMLEFLDRMDEAENLIATRKVEFSELDKEIKHEKEKIEFEAAQNQKRLHELDVDWKDVSEKADPKLLDTFNATKKVTDGRAMVPVKNAVCLGCNLNIPPQLYNEIQRLDSLRNCPFCQRLIYWKDNS